MEAKFSKSDFTKLTDDPARRALCAELSAVLTRRMQQASEFGTEARTCVEELRALGHDLWSFDECDDFQTWCPNYKTPTGPGVVVTFSAPDEVTVEWSAK